MNNDRTTTTQSQTAFAELAGIALAEHSLDSVMAKIAELAKSTLAAATEVSVTLVEKGVPRTIACTGELALRLDERQYDHGYGPCLDSLAGVEPVLIQTMSTEERWRDWAQEATRQGARSSLSVPVPVQREVSAALNIYITTEDAFDADHVDLAKTFASYAGVALANMHLYQAQAQVAAQLQEAMDSRAVIEQAKGILMGQERCDAQTAFNLLVTSSQRSQRKLRDVAQALVDEATTNHP